jgi:hypothetical protein
VFAKKQAAQPEFDPTAADAQPTDAEFSEAPVDGTADDITPDETVVEESK